MSGPFGSSQWMYNAGGSFYPYSIDQSLRFNDDDSANLNRTPSTAGDRQVWTWSAWLKRSTLSTTQYLFVGGSSADNATYVRFFSNDKFQIFHYDSNSTTNNVQTEQVFRDVSSWYHIVLAVDTTQATSSDRVKIYVNGERVTNFTTATYPSLNFNYDINTTGSHRIGSNYNGSGTFFDGYMAEVHFADGTQYDASTFGETINGIWVPKEVSGLTYGTNGFYLSFADSSAIGDDLSGNTNDWTANNLAASDVVPDSPTNNFATLNSLYVDADSTPTYSEGNLRMDATSTSWFNSTSTFMQASGKWYAEFYVAGGTGSVIAIGTEKSSSTFLGTDSNAYGYIGTTGNIWNSGTGTAYGDTFTTGDVIGVALDLDGGNVYFYKNGTIQNSGTAAATGLTGEWFIGCSTSGSSGEVRVNFGQEGTFAGATTAGGNTDANGIGDFKYAVPSGFLALCSANLPEVTIGPNSTTTSDEHFNTVLYTGDGTTSRSITGVGFAPDFVWIKNRTNASTAHSLFNIIMGPELRLSSNSTGVEQTKVGTVTSFDADGFTTGNNDITNKASTNFVSWNWKAGGTASTIAVDAYSAGVPSIASSVSANQDAGFSIVSWTGTGADATVGHGLSSAPDLVIVKNRSIVSSWLVRHSFDSISNTPLLENTTGGIATNYWQTTQPDSSVFYVSSNSEANGSTNNLIAYCFANTEGHLKCGKYVGNSNANGTFVYTGFRPAWIMLKRLTSGAGWSILDNTRNAYNPSDAILQPNTDNAEGTSYPIDFVSNGVKFRTTDSTHNQTGSTYIYLAFAEAPFKYANAR